MITDLERTTKDYPPVRHHNDVTNYLRRPSVDARIIPAYRTSLIPAMGLIAAIALVAYVLFGLAPVVLP